MTIRTGPPRELVRLVINTAIMATPTTAEAYWRQRWSRLVTLMAHIIKIGCHDPLSDLCMLTPQLDNHIGQLCGIF
jgi:hypothetical protein